MLQQQQIENTIDPLLPKESGANSGEAVKISGAKRPVEECPSNSPSQHQGSTINPPASVSGSGHLVYVRRKAEAEPGRSSSGCDNTRRDDGPQVTRISSSEPIETTQQQQAELKEPIMTQVLSTSGASSEVLSSTKPPSLSSSLPRSNVNLVPSLPAHHITSTTTTNSVLADPKRVEDINSFHERYCNLQKLLEELERSSQDDYIQMLRSLSSVELSKHAVELEKRCIQLSLEEAKELQRVRVLDVLGRYSSHL